MTELRDGPAGSAVGVERIVAGYLFRHPANTGTVRKKGAVPVLAFVGAVTLGDGVCIWIDANPERELVGERPSTRISTSSARVEGRLCLNSPTS